MFLDGLMECCIVDFWFQSSESSGTIGGSRWKKKQQQRATSLKPFKLRTEVNVVKLNGVHVSLSTGFGVGYNFGS